MHFFQKCVESSVATQFGKDEVLENFLDKGKLPWFNATIVCPILLYSIHLFVYYIPRQDFLRTDEDLLWTCSQVRFDWKHPWNHLQIWKSCNNIAPRNRWTMNMCWSHINILSPFRRNSVDTPKKTADATWFVVPNPLGSQNGSTMCRSGRLRAAGKVPFFGALPRRWAV